MDSNMVSVTCSVEQNAVNALEATTVMTKPINSTSTRCPCAKGYVYQLSASAIQKTQMNSAKKNYCYVMDVRRSDGNYYHISRTYGDIVGLNNSLPQVKQLIMEKKLKKNEIPKLPDRIERTKDLLKLNRYFDAILRLQEGNDLLSKVVGNFCRQDNSCDACRIEEFELLTSQENASVPKTEGLQQELKHISAPLVLASGRITLNYKSDDRRQLSLMQNTIVKILRKCSTGWWFVICGDRSGWFPASYIELLDKTDSEEAGFLQTPANYKADRDYCATNDDELSFKKNDPVSVKQKNMDGWWIAEINGRDGYVPAAYLRPSEKTVLDSDSFELCCETMNMSLASRRPCSDTVNKTRVSSKSESNNKAKKQLSLQGLVLMPEEEIVKGEKIIELHHPDSMPSGMIPIASNTSNDVLKEKCFSSSDKNLTSTMDQRINDKTQL